MEGSIDDNCNYDELLDDKEYLRQIGTRQLNLQPSLTSIPETTQFSDYLSTGQTIGEVAFLTNAPRNAVAKCDTSVQLYYVMYEALQVCTV